jgi:hypothetical protein
MPYPVGTIGLASPIGTTASGDVHATHYDFLGNGGFRVVDTLGQRDDITLNRRAWGMMVYVRANATYYKLCTIAEGGASDNLDDDNNWEIVTMGGTEGPMGPQGEPGEPGPMGPSTPSNLTFLGYYNSGTSYVYGDVVMFPINGTPGGTPPVASYVVMGNTATGVPLNPDGSINTAGGWAFFATAGPAGVNGSTGPMGPQGNQGEAGQNGDTGADGNKWYTGDVLPGLAGITDAVNGDLYLYLAAGGNTEEGNGDVYVYQDGDWVDAPAGNIQGPDGADGGGTWPYGNTPTTAQIAGSGYAVSGQNLEGLSAFQILQQLLFPYQSPAITAFNVYDASAAANSDLQDTEVIVNTVLSGNRWFKITTSNASNFATTPSFRISQQTSADPLTYIYGTSTTYNPVPPTNTTFVVAPGTPITINSIGFSTGGSTVTWRASALSNQTPGVVVNSPTYTVTWRYPVYWIASSSTSLSAAEIQAGQTMLNSSENGVYPLNPYVDSKYIYICYPDSGDNFGTFTNMIQSGSGAPTGSNAIITTVDPAAGVCTGCTSYDQVDSSGRYYKSLDLSINGLTITYRLYRSLNIIAIGQFSIV